MPGAVQLFRFNLYYIDREDESFKEANLTITSLHEARHFLKTHHVYSRLVNL